MAAKDSTVDDLDGLYRKAKSARARLEPIWYMNLAFYEGRQWLAWSGGRLYQPQLKPSRFAYTENRVQPIVRKELARLTKNRPTFNVIPNSGDEEDANAARLGDDVLLYLWRHLHIARKRMRALRWSRICGAGFLKVFWDPSLGNTIEALVDSNGRLFESPNGGGVVRNGTPEAQMAQQVAARQGAELVVKKISQGDLRLEVRSPFQMFIDPLADAFEEAEWLVEESVKSKEYVRQRYGVQLEPDTPANPGLIEARMGTLEQGSGGYMGIKIREYWCKPNSQYPQGCRTVWAPKGSKTPGAVLEQDNAPFDPMPYVMFTGIPVPGRLLGQGIVEQLRGPQTEFNKVRSQMAENRNRVGNPTIAISRQSMGSQDVNKVLAQLTAPGGVYFYDETGSQNAVPGIIQAPPLPEYVVNEPAMIEEGMQEISGQHEVTSAQVPPGVTAAAAIDLLQEADDTMIAPDVADHEDELSELGEKVLKLVGRYYTDARTLEIGGDNASWQIFDFRGSMLRGNTRVQVQAGSAFPRSKAQKQAQMQDFLTYMAQSGQPIQGRALAKFLEDWGFGGQGRFIEQYTVTETQCNRENAQMAQGFIVSTNDYDDDEGHIANHEDFQRAPHYALLVQQDPRIGEVFETHVAAHRQKLAMIQQQQQQMMLAAQGQDPQQMQQQQVQDTQGQAQQIQAQQAEAAQQQQGAAQQQGFSQAQAEQQQRHAEEAHQQKLRQAEEAHQARMQQMAAQQRQGARK